jgi:uncharacterized membrane protein YfcA
MGVLEIAGFAAAILIGISLGLIGGGGSILTVPILVYLLNVPPVMATAYSLFVVGITSAVGAFRNGTKKSINFKAAIVFSIPSLIAVFLTRRFLIPAIPEQLAQWGAFTITKDLLIMTVFAALMVFTSFSMIRQRKIADVENHEDLKFNYPVIILEGIIVGALTGFVGAGGGFLIIPALVIFTKLPMKIAIGTSLLIISVKSLIGFGGDLYNSTAMDWSFLLIFTGLSVIGIFIGTKLCHITSSQKLKPAFGWFVLVMGCYIIVKELLNAKF